MTTLWYIELGCLGILFLIGLYYTLRGLEQTFPAFKAWLDIHFPEPDQDIWK